MNGAVLGRGLKKLDFGLSDTEESCAHFLVGHFLDGEAFEAEHIFVEGDCLVEARHGYADVFDVGNVHCV